MPILPAAIAIVLSDDHCSILLTQRRDVPVWVLPGGGIEKGETSEEALLREVKEETSIEVEIIRKCAEYTPINQLAAPTTVYICIGKSGELKLSTETAAAGFFPLDQLPASLFPPHALWLEEGLASTVTIERELYEISYGALLKYIIRHPFQVIRFAWTRFVKTPWCEEK